MSSFRSGRESYVRSFEMVISTSQIRTFSPRKKVLVFSLLCLFMGLVIINVSHLFAFLPLYNEARNISQSWTGIILGTKQIGLITGPAFLGPFMMTRFPTGSLLSSNALCLGILTLLSSCLNFLASNIAFEILFLAAYNVVGLLAGVLYVIVLTCFIAIYPNSVSTATAMGQAVISAATAFGPFIGAFLYAARGFKLSFVVIGFLTIGSAVPAIFVPNLTGGGKKQKKVDEGQEETDEDMIINGDEDEEEIEGEEKIEWKKLMDLRLLFPLWHLVLSCTLAAFYLPIISVHAKNDLNADVLWIGVTLMLGAIVDCLSSPILGILSDKIGPWKMLITSSIAFPLVYICVGPLPLLAALKITPSKTQLIVALSFMGIARPMACVPAISAMFSIYRCKNQGNLPKWASNALVSLYATSYGFGYLIGEFVSGFIISHASFGWSTGTLGLVYILQSCACIIFCVNEMKISRTLVAEEEKSQTNGKEYGTFNVTNQ